MGFLDKAKELLGKHDDKVDQALNKAGDAAKKKFAGHEQHIDTATKFARERTGSGDTTAQQPGQAPPPQGQQPGQAPPPQGGQQPPPPPQQ
ncbi:antitoxin [Pseudonocardia sp. NPDC049635]|uniref:antitoxin n=1 Tax=Pseudonocardia sp. NPDC049635 TaxID=3155506 RepID=UPI00340689C8